MNTDTSRISISAHYTGYVWYKNGLSDPRFVTSLGRAANLFFLPINSTLKLFTGSHIDTFLMQRHQVLDFLLTQLIEEQGVEQIVELASGLSPRGFRMTERYPQLSYIETDLPGMAARKAKLLNRLKRPARHEIRSCNILEAQGPESIQAILSSLDKSKKTVIISEGLVNYFELATIKGVWSRIANELKIFEVGYYLTDLYPDSKSHPSYKHIKKAQKIVEVLTRGEWPLHYENDQQIVQGFKEDGFVEVKVIDPVPVYKFLNLPLPKSPSVVRLIQAKA